MSETATAWSRKNPFQARVLTNRRLTGAYSAKDTRHYELSLEGSGLSYEAGDSLGIYPTNCMNLVQEWLEALHCTGNETVTGAAGESMQLRQALWKEYALNRPTPQFLAALAEKSGPEGESLRSLLAPERKDELERFLDGREMIDLLVAHPSACFAPEELLPLLRRMVPRLYSISSSLKAHPGQVHLTIATVRYESHGRARKGVCSTLMAERVPVGGTVPVFFHTSNFRLPEDSSTPIIMVGPGTGIAPFRAFLQERRAVGSSGRNWLFFGDQRASEDFLYRDELEAWHEEGFLTRLDTAFSRDQAAKVYVQHRMQEQGAELWRWLEEGASFFVCGDAARMAKDVDAALRQIIATHGGRSPEEAAHYVEALEKSKRYKRDVY